MSFVVCMFLIIRYLCFCLSLVLWCFY